MQALLIQRETVVIYFFSPPIRTHRYQEVALDVNSGATIWRNYSGGNGANFYEGYHSIINLNNKRNLLSGVWMGHPYQKIVNLDGDSLSATVYPSISGKIARTVMNSDSTLYSILHNKIMCTDLSGNLLWIKTYACTSFKDIKLNSKDECVIIGAPISSNNTCLFSIDKNGTLLWEQTYPIWANEAFDIWDDDTFIIANIKCAMVKKTGEIIWDKFIEGEMTSIGVPYNISEVEVTSDGGIIFGGNKKEFGNFPYFLAKTDCLGNLTWDVDNCLIKSDLEIIAFPNPVSSQFTIQIPNKDDVNSLVLHVYNVSGQLISSKNSSNSIISIDLNKLSSGIYIYKIIIDDKDIKTGKLMKL